MMAGGDFMHCEASKRLMNSSYECDSKYVDEIDEGKKDDYQNIQHVNPAIYIESFHDNITQSDQIKESDYLLDLSALEPATSRTSILTSETCSFRKGSGNDIRYINSAIFIERVDGNSGDEVEFNDDKEYQGTYRKTEVKYVQPSKIFTKKLNGKNIASIPHTKSASNYGKSLKSKSSIQADSYVVTDDENRPRGLSFDEWLASKQQLNRKNKVNSEQMGSNKHEGERRRRIDEQREDFKRWLSIKREQDKLKKKEREMQKTKVQQEEEFKKKRAMEKESMLKSWIMRKDEQLKEKKRREEMEKRKQEEEKKMRKELSAKAFEEWKEKSKYNPRPVPLNMGVESLRGSVSALQFVNPTPWQENIDLRQSSA